MTYIDYLRSAVILPSIALSNDEVLPFFLEERFGLSLYFDFVLLEDMLMLEVSRVDGERMLHGPCGNSIEVILKFECCL
jgi:hypothetical protein